MKKYIITCITALVSLFTHAQALEEGLLFEISGNHLSKPSYVFGTFHLGLKPTDERFKIYTDAIKKVDVMYGEMNMDSTNLMNVMIKGLIASDTILEQCFTPEDFAFLKKYLKDSLQTDIAGYRKMKPMMVYSIMSIALAQKELGESAVSYSIDKELQTAAKKAGKKIGGFETDKQQAAMLFESMPLKAQANYVIKALKEEIKNEGQTKTMIDDYTHGRLQHLQDMANGTYTDDFEKILITNRNEKWLAKMDAILPTQSMFIAVGALHLTGSKGLINQLRARGYTVKVVK
jgi:uncharacterized protein YbaP (TraB family)